MFAFSFASIPVFGFGASNLLYVEAMFSAVLIAQPNGFLESVQCIWVVSASRIWFQCRKYGVFTSQIIHLFIGFSIICTIHFGGKIPLFLETSMFCWKCVGWGWVLCPFRHNEDGFPCWCAKMKVFHRSKVIIELVPPRELTYPL